MGDQESRDGERYFEIQPCGRFASCNGSICVVNNITKTRHSLGIPYDITYGPAFESMRVRYTNGDICNPQTKKRWASMIYVTCDPYAGLGKPSIREIYDCLIMFDWRTSFICKGTSSPLPPKTLPPKSQEPLPVKNGMSWGIIFLTLIVICSFGILLVQFCRKIVTIPSFPINKQMF